MVNSVSLSRVLAWCRYLRSLPRRTRRALQRTCKQSLAGVALLFALGHAPAEAATIVVNASCRLVNAIRAANTDTATGGCPRGSGADTIRLPAGSTQTLTTVNNSTYGPTGLPVISSKITIEGNDSTIRRGSSAPDFRIFAVNGRGNLTLKETTVSGGGSGWGRLLLATRGGGVFNDGTLTITNSTLSGNSAFSATAAACLTQRYGILTITDSTLSGNSP